MSITMFNPAPGPIGYGWLCQFQISAGPVPNDDYVVATIREDMGGGVPGVQYTSMTTVTHGSLFPEGIMGSTETHPRVVGITGGTPASTNVLVIVQQRHNSGALVATTVLTGFTWDAHMGLGELVYQVANAAAIDVSAILAAVVNPLPTLP